MKLNIPNIELKNNKSNIVKYISCVIEGDSKFTPYITSNSEYSESWCLDSTNNWLLTFKNNYFEIQYRYDTIGNPIAKKLIDWLSFSLGVVYE